MDLQPTCIPFDRNRRLRLLRITGELFADMLKAGPPSRWIRCTRGLPHDAEFVAFSDDPFGIPGDVVMKFRSSQWSPVELGESVPFLRACEHPQFMACDVSPDELKLLDQARALRNREPIEGGDEVRRGVVMTQEEFEHHRKAGTLLAHAWKINSPTPDADPPHVIGGGT